MLDGVKVFIKNKSTGKFLFHLRDNDPNIPNPNKWSLFGGGIEKDESPEEALKREVLEEIGIEIDSISLIETIPITQKVKEKEFPIKIYLFKAETKNNQITKLTEGKEAAWFNIDEILEKDLVPNLKLLLEKHSGVLEE